MSSKPISIGATAVKNADEEQVIGYQENISDIEAVFDFVQTMLEQNRPRVIHGGRSRRLKRPSRLKLFNGPPAFTCRENFK